MAAMTHIRDALSNLGWPGIIGMIVFWFGVISIVVWLTGNASHWLKSIVVIKTVHTVVFFRAERAPWRIPI